MTKPCRAAGYYASTVLAETTILPYLQEKLPKDSLFSETVLVIVSNEAYYGSILPSEEITAIDQQAKEAQKKQRKPLTGIKNLPVATAFATAISQSFHLVSPQDWLWTINPKTKQFETGNQDYGNTLRYRIAKVQLLNTNAEELLDYPKEVQLDRLATSAQDLKIVQSNGEEDILLRLISSNRLRPDKLQLEFTGPTTGKPWQIGSQPLPSSPVTIDLKEGKGEGVSQQIPLLKTVLKESPSLTANDPPLTPGKIRFRLRFLYDSGVVNGQPVYNHHYVDTDWHTITVQPVEAETIPARQFFSLLKFPEITFANQTLAAQYDKSQDSEGLTQKIARTRIEASRHSQQQQTLTLLIAAIVLWVIIFGYLSYLFFYDRRFQPRLEWRPADNVTINFNEQPGARLLVGILTVFNDGTVPWFGKLLGNQKYPDHTVALSLEYLNNQFAACGFLLNDEAETTPTPLGFLSPKNKTKLKRSLEKYRVSHDTPVYIFLATETIKDFLVPNYSQLDFGGKDTPMSVILKGRSLETPPQKIPFRVELLLEEPQPPHITYAPNPAPLHFKRGERLCVGIFRLESRAKHHCAKPFTGNFSILARQHNLPLPENAITLDNPQVTVSPQQTVTIQVLLHCDGTNISNPNPPSEDYLFELRGDLSPHSDRGPHKLTLYRDPTRADLHLDLLQFRKTHRIHWETAGDTYGPPIRQLLVDGNVKDTSDLLSNKQLVLESLLVKFDDTKPAATLFEIQVGNTGTSGRGWVKVTLNLSLTFNSPASILCHSGHHIDDILYLITPTGQGIFSGSQELLVKEGDRPKKWIIQIHPAKILQNIEGGRINEDQGHLQATLEIEIVTDQMVDNQGVLTGFPRRHQLTLTAGIGLEKLPHPNWLAIDFGTAAIAAAIGKEKNIYLLPLQKITDQNFGDYDPGNLEAGTNFLPSYVICDADLRQGLCESELIRPGYPTYQPASLKPGAPDFIGLPASSKNLRERPGRIIYSLKSWLTQPSEHIILPDLIEFEEQGKRVTRHELLLDKLVESGWAALASAYITACPEFEKGGRVVLSHPNTFTSFHQNKLHDIAWRALSGPLGIALPERLRLLSESDAVAYHYCQQRRNQGQSKTGPELLLVYDFGAGTLDLSLIHISWSPEGYPDQWQVENRLGVPIAGNYLDSLLARLIHHRLVNLAPDLQKMVDYQYPLVAKQLKGYSEEDKERHEHREAVRRLWEAIREAKQGTQDTVGWDGEMPFYVKIGKLGETGIVSVTTGATLPIYNHTEKPPLGGNSKGDIYLCIPANEVHGYIPLQNFIQFVTKEVITELLDGAGRTAAEVNTVIISGRGALWAHASEAGIRKQVWEQFPQAEKPDLTHSQQVKSAVVSGAIAWQQLVREFKPIEPQRGPRLAILREPDQLTLEDDWPKGPINLKGTDTFWLVQVSLKRPNPGEDLKTLRRYFYIRLAKMNRNWEEWTQNPYLYVRKEQDGERIRVRLENSKGQGFDFTTFGTVGQVSSLPPWPIGQILLTPEEE
jgi:hypothetical protein